MAIHLVGRAPPATVPIVQVASFSGMREVSAEIEGTNAVDEEGFAHARVECQAGIDPKPGDVCLLCPRLRSWRAGAVPGEVLVSCAWGSHDPVWARMTGPRALVHVTPDTTCVDAERRVATEGVRRVVVLSNGQLVGVASRGALARGALAKTTVDQVMAREVFVIGARATLGEAAGAMAELRVGCLPVIEDGFLVGIITRGDLRRAGAPAELFS